MRIKRLFFVLSACVLLPLAAAAGPVKQNLHDNWTFKQKRGTNWYAATVPGVVHTDLMANGLIEDPFFRLNERGVQWVDKEDWVYKTTFDVGPELFGKDNISIVFEGLDTYAEVTLNGEKIITADNMFRQWRADVKKLLKEKGNELEILFTSPIAMAMPQWEAAPWHDIIESGNDQSWNGGLRNRRVGVFVRKAGYHFGWDWGPRLVTSGIWKPAMLEGWDDARINDVWYNQKAVDAKEASIDVTVEVVADKDMDNATVSVMNRTDKKMAAVKKTALKKGLNKVTVSFKVKKPKLWWTNGLGEQFLYDFTAELALGGKSVDSHDQKLGLRSIRVVTEPDRWGESFYVELNGVPVFMKGANYIPLDNFLPRVTDEKYEKTILDAVASNMNMIRVWGGGIYENDIFYDLCDKYGILVWQDFMFSCALYPAEGELMENIRQEAIENVRRLRSHTCLALWCGNNECLDMWFHWGVKRRYERYNPEWAEIQWRQFTDLYYKVLPEVVAEHHPGIAYRKSSPYSDDHGMRSDSIGDYHDWDVWGQALEFDRFNHIRSRFFSEYGFQGFPSMQTIQRFAPSPEDWAVTSEVMLSHQRAGTTGNQKIEMMLLRDYGQYRDFESFTYMSQLMQADAMKIAMESHRRQMPRCMGSLIWQLNDCWPVASWSGRDYYGTWKAQQYAIKRAFDDILVSPIVEDGVLKVYAVSDRLADAGGRIEVTVYNGSEVRGRYGADISVQASNSTVVWEHELSGLLDTSGNMFVNVAFTDASGRVYTNNYFPAKNKDMQYEHPEIQKSFRGITDGETAGYASGYEVTLVSDVFARGVYLSVDGITDYFVTDNYFDLLPGVPKTVRILTDESIYEIENQLDITTLADARSL